MCVELEKMNWKKSFHAAASASLLAANALSIASFSILKPFPLRPEMGTLATGGAVCSVALLADCATAVVAASRTAPITLRV